MLFCGNLQILATTIYKFLSFFNFNFICRIFTRSRNYSILRWGWSCNIVQHLQRILDPLRMHVIFVKDPVQYFEQSWQLFVWGTLWSPQSYCSLIVAVNKRRKNYFIGDYFENDWIYYFHHPCKSWRQMQKQIKRKLQHSF